MYEIFIMLRHLFSCPCAVRILSDRYLSTRSGSKVGEIYWRAASSLLHAYIKYNVDQLYGWERKQNINQQNETKNYLAEPNRFSIVIDLNFFVKAKQQLLLFFCFLNFSLLSFVVKDILFF